ncbi:MAG: hypothetical protein ABW184_13435, partial [Sphingobium sp.]
MTEIAEYIAAAVALHVRHNRSSIFLKQTDYDGLRSTLASEYGVYFPINAIKQSLLKLESLGICMVISDPYTHDYFAIDENANDHVVDGY